MGFGETITALFIIAAIVWLRSQKYKSRGGSTAGPIESREPELEQEIEDLRKRIAVLERIATDDRQETDLKRQIEALRD